MGFNSGFKGLTQNVCFGFLYNFFFSETFLILRRIQRDAVINTYRSKCRL